MTTPCFKARTKWRVQKTKNGLRWLAWPIGKKKQGQVFENWNLATKYATMMAFVNQVMMEKS